MEHPFFMRTITEAWDWLIHVPVLGFVAFILVSVKLITEAIWSAKLALLD